MSQAAAPAGGIVRTSLDATWRTPERLLDAVRTYFGGPIPLDPASGPDNPTQALRFFTGEVPSATPALRQESLFGDWREHDELARSRVNGLEQSWAPRFFVNPPYGRELRDWLAKMRDEARARSEGVALLPCARFEQGYFQETFGAASALCWIRGRVDFISSIDGQAVRGNPYASMLLGFNASWLRWRSAFGGLGACYQIGPGGGGW